MEEFGNAIRRVQDRIRDLEIVEGQHQRELQSTWAVPPDPYYMEGGVSAVRPADAPEVFLDGAGRPAAISGVGFQPDALLMTEVDGQRDVVTFDEDGFTVQQRPAWQQWDRSVAEARSKMVQGFWPASFAWECKCCRYPRNGITETWCEACGRGRLYAKLIVEWAEPAEGWS